MASIMGRQLDGPKSTRVYSPRARPTLMSYLSTRRRRPYRNVIDLACNHEPFLHRMDFMKKLPVHDGCVNTIQWNKTGEYILSGSDDCKLCITKPYYMFDSRDDYTVLHKIPTRHLGNIFSARFIPNSGDQQIVSCSSEGPVMVHDISSTDPSEALLTYNCHSSTIYEVVTVPDDDKTFLTCGEDKTIRLFDMRVHSSCARAGTCPHPALIRNSNAMTTLALHPTNSNLMLVGRADGMGLVYDRRRLPDVTKFSRERAHKDRLAGLASQHGELCFRHPLEGVVAQFTVPNMEEKYKFTSLCYNKDGTEVLASYSGDYIYLFSHDRSSNMELIQTLPKQKQASSCSHESAKRESNGAGDTAVAAAADRDAGGASSSNHRSRQSGTSTESKRHSSNGASDASSSRAAARISRIRVRGDWSDTGVNSVPFSRLPAYGQLEQPRDPDQIAVTLGNRQLGTRSRFIPIGELIAGPIQYGSPQPNGESTNHRESREQNILEEEEEEEEEEDDDEENEFNADLDEENSTVIDDWESARGDDIDMNDDEDEDDEDVDDQEVEFNRYAENCVENLIEEARERHLRRQGDESSQDYSDTAAASTCDSSSTTSENQPSGARAKFRKTLDNLKSKYNHIPAYKPRVKYQGHRNSRTSIKEATFWGDNFILSGSDCGRIFVWEKETARLVMAFPADDRVVNCLAPNPHQYVLASSGIDHDIKLWSTQSLKSNPLKINDEEMSKIVENNEMMLEESKHTISVPPHLFFRVLASLVHSSR